MKKEIISGKIFNIEPIKEVSTKLNPYAKVLNFTVIEKDKSGTEYETEEGAKKKAGFFYKVTAWDENAEDIHANYEKGSEITLVVNKRALRLDNGKFENGYTVAKIDKENTLSKQIDNLLTSYVVGRISQIAEIENNDVFSDELFNSEEQEKFKAIESEIETTKELEY